MSINKRNIVRYQISDIPDDGLISSRKGYTFIAVIFTVISRDKFPISGDHSKVKKSDKIHCTMPF